MHMQLGTIIRVLDVPATIPAETAPLHVPEPSPAVPATVPATPNANPAIEASTVPVRTARSAACAR